MGKTEWVACPHCGGEIRSDAKACRHCGSDEETGWSEATYLDGIDLPEEDDYGDALEREGFLRDSTGGARNRSGGAGAGKAGSGLARLAMGAVALGLMVVFAYWLLRGLFKG